MPDSLQSIDKQCVFRETFESEQAVRRNGGVPTAVTFSNGVATFNGTSSLIRYPNISRGTYSIRIVLSRLVIDTKYLYDFSERGNLGLGYCHITAGSGNIAIGNGSSYINGVSSGVATTETKEIVITGTAVNCNLANWTIGNAIAHSYPINMDISLFEIYTGTLTADEVKNLYENKRYAVSDFNHTEQLGQELITNGGFDTDTWWIKVNNVSINNGVGTLTADGTTNQEIYKNILTIGKRYKVEYEITENNITGGTQYNQLTNSSGIIWDNGTVLWDSSVGHHIFYGICTNTWIDFRTTTLATSGTVSIDNVSVKEVLADTTKEILNVSALNGVITNRYSGDPYGNNLVTNSGLEVSFIDSNGNGLADNWGVTNSAIYNITEGIQGRTAQKITRNGNNYPWISQSVIVVGKTYRISLWYRSNCLVRIISNSAGSSYWLGSSTNWTYIDIIYNLQDTTNIGVGGETLYEGQWFEFTMLSVKEVIPSPVSTDVQVVKENGIYAMKFNKNSYSNINCGSYDTLVGDKTFVYWNKGKKDTADTYIMSNGNFHIDEKTSGESLLYITNDNWNGVVYSVSFTLATYLNRWKHIVVTRKSSGVVQIYLNGVAQTMGVIAGGTITPGTNIIIGYSNSYNPFDGHIGSLSIYDGILTAQEISQMYSSEKHLYGL
jgi:hypothetical protein